MKQKTSMLRAVVIVLLILKIEISTAQDSGLGSYLSRTTAMPVRAETLKESDSEKEFVGWLEGFIVTNSADSLYGYIKYDLLKQPEILAFKTEGAQGQQTLYLGKVASFNFLEQGKQYIRYFTVIHSSTKRPEVVEKVVAGTIGYWKKAKVYHYGSRGANTVTIPKTEYDYYFSIDGQLQKVKNFKKQLIALSSPFDLDPNAIAKEKKLKLSNPVERAMLVYHLNELIDKP